MSDFALKGTLSLDSKQFQTSTKQSAKATSSFSNKASADFEALGKAGKLAFAGMIAAAAVWIKNSAQLAVTAEETVSKFHTVTGASASLAAGLMEDANLFGMTTTEMQGVIAATAGLAQGFGFAQEESVLFAEDTVRLSGDLASFHDVAGGAAEVSGILKAAYAGEREQLKRLDIIVTQADVDQQALNETNKQSVKELTAADKAAATYTLVVERAGVAVGDLGRTSESTANKQRTVAAAFREVQEEAGQKLIPTLNTLMEIGTDALPMFAAVMGEIVELLAGFIEGLAKVGDVVGKIPGPLLGAAAAAGTLKVALMALSAHPVLAGLAVVAGAVALVGKSSRDSIEGVAALVDQAVELNGVFEEAAIAEFIGEEDLKRFEEAGITLADLAAAAGEGEDAFNDLDRQLDDTKGVLDFATNEAGFLKLRLIELREAGTDTTDTLAEMALATDLAGREAIAAARAADALERGHRANASAATLAAEAQDALTEALRGYVDEQKAALDPVFAQIQATQDLAAAQADLSAADIEFGAGSEEASAAVLDVVEAQLDLDAANTAIVESGESALNTVREVGNRADLTGTQMQGLTGDVRDAEEAAEDFAGDYQAYLDADTTPAQRAVAEWQTQAAEEVVATVQAVIRVTAFSAGNVRGFASGTRSAPTGLGVVGERGRELVDFGTGGQRVFPNDQTERILNTASSSATVMNLKAIFNIRETASAEATSRTVIRKLDSELKKFNAGQRRPT